MCTDYITYDVILEPGYQDRAVILEKQGESSDRMGTEEPRPCGIRLAVICRSSPLRWSYTKTTQKQ